MLRFNPSWPRSISKLICPLLVVAIAVAPRTALAAGENPLPGAQQSDVDAQQVRQAIQKGVDYLERKEDLDKDFGHWPDYPHYIGSTTCLCAMALLYAGVPASDPHVAKAVSYLRTLNADKLGKTYTVSLQTMVFCLAEPNRDLLLIQRNVKWLEETQITDRGNSHRGGWSYPGLGNGDNSNSQFALLALYEAERVGVPVKDQTWRLALDYWKAAQNFDGSFGYYNLTNKGEIGTGSMTCAGIASLVIASGRVGAGEAQADGDQIHCCGNQEADDSAERVERALQWLGKEFTVQNNPRGQQSLWHFYFLYGVERIGRLTARRFIGNHDWYREGAALLVSPGEQLIGGEWQNSGSSLDPEHDPNIATSFAILFLAKGRRPILMAKLKHGPDNDWNHHHSDVANLTSYVETKWSHEFPLGLSWQVIDLSKAKVEDLLQSPVLYLNGSEVPDIDDRQGQVLRDYIDRGGFIFAEACCADAEGFDRGFRALMKRVFPPEYQLKVLPPEHPIWHAEETVPAELQRTLMGIDYGCRTSVVYCPPPKPGDPPGGLSCLWELSAGHNRRYSPAVAAQIDAADKIGINVLAYATNRELKTKDQSFKPKAEKSSEDNFARDKIYIAKLRHAGGCDAAPAALPHLLEAAASELQIRVSTEQRLIDITDPSLFKYHLVFMHGRRSFRFTAAEREQLRKFIDRGGTLMADSICANPEFTAAFRREMQAIFADDPDVKPKGQGLTPIAGNDPLFSRQFGGYDLSKVTLREPLGIGTEGRESANERKIEPELEGLKIGDRWGVIFSKFDLSCALEKHDSLECKGYTREDAERIGLNILLYSLHQ
ncbi:MAG TPA: DUF4159 domain-containing protein [Pirellulales bacterium]|jgi:hypothetical protein|nr:DUF4159 domain-containing protein [Pirellulales bacterium]